MQPSAAGNMPVNYGYLLGGLFAISQGGSSQKWFGPSGSTGCMLCACDQIWILLSTLALQGCHENKECAWHIAQSW